MKLFTVTIEIEAVIVVVADDEAAAEELAKDVVASNSDFDIREHLPFVHAAPFTRLPEEWDDHSIPFGGADDKTIADWRAAGDDEEAEEARQAEFRRAQGDLFSGEKS